MICTICAEVDFNPFIGNNRGGFSVCRFLRLLNNLRRDLYANLLRPFLAVLAVVIVKVFHMAPASVLLTPLALAGVLPKSRQMSVRSNYCRFLE